ncbi:MAG TPA: hypothetical protein VNX21_04285 [Candidatus Thermoplasmatota archaeon]|nr:hypothetical protein [Candidatus Thermoplasmatota archaeon]
MEDDGEVTRARLALERVSDALLFAAMDEIMRENARRRFGGEPAPDPEATFYHDGTVRPGPLEVDARPGRAAGGWWWFVARIVQEGQERAHLERRMRRAP